jgi:hypothetical protein
VTTVLLAATTVMCGVLTVAFLGTLRTLTQLRLRLAGYGEGALPTSALLGAGVALPAELVDAIPDPGDDAIVAFLSGTCESCWSLADELGRVDVDQVLACVVDEADELAERLPARVTIVEPSAAARAAESLGIDVTPVVIHQRDGYVVGASYGSSAHTVSDVNALAAASGPPLRREVIR